MSIASPASDMFLLFAEDFETPASFVDSLAQRLGEEHAADQ